ncbi:serine hydrolase domain-containing protein [Microbulbifer sp. 2304DJ12-6]|uniref:serine hydrolase domain-containing protein n=1 Tax=Microbulbifer sp. 2304DJ12-6 TaxID=3233340 RepID=UPI0039B0D5FE
MHYTLEILKQWVGIIGAMATFLAMPLHAADSHNTLNGLIDNLRPRYVVGDVMPRYTLADRMEYYGVPGVAIGIIKDGKLIHAEGFGVLQRGSGEKIDGHTLFSAGSVSKIATATILLKMDAAGLLDIDGNITQYLKSWQLPKSDRLTDDGVSLRMILSHTAGFNIHGFADFLPGEELPTVIETLNGVSPAQHGPLEFLYRPGNRYKYSGGGYTLAQLVATDITGESYPATAKKMLFTPMGMTRSNFTNPLPMDTQNVAKAHNRDGNPVALPRGYEAMPEMAASGLWTSAHDLGTLTAALINSFRTKHGFLPRDLAVDMMTKVTPSKHGMGPMIDGSSQDLIFHHGGANNSYRAWIEGNLATGDGLVVLTNGARGNDLIIEIRNSAADVLDWSHNRPVYISRLDIGAEQLASFEGAYRPSDSFPLSMREQMVGRFFDATVQIALKDGGLQISRRGSDRWQQLIPTGPNRFMFPAFAQRIGMVELTFHRNARRQTKEMSLTVPSATSYYQRIEE